MKWPRTQPTFASLLLLGCAAYVTSFAGRFQFDDFYLIVNNPDVASVSAAWRSLLGGLRPFTKLTLALNVSWHGLQPFGFHLINLGIHLGSGFLLYRIARDASRSASQGFSTAWFATAIFLLHPAQTEAVTYISGRSTSLMTACLLLSLWLAIRAGQSTEQSLLWRLASLGAFLLAVLAKEVALVCPVLYLIWLTVVERRAVRQAGVQAAPYAALSLVLFLGILVHPRYHQLVSEAAYRFSWPQVALSQVRAVVDLLGVVVFPWRVNIDHALPPAHSIREVWPHLFILIGVALLAVRSWRSSRLLTGGLLWGLAALLPTHSLLVREDLMADRLLYLPMVGFSLAGAELFAGLCGGVERRFPKIVLWPVAVVTVSLGLGVATTQRNLLYCSEVALWRDSIAKAPQNPRAHHNLGYAYELNGNLQLALQQYRIALSLQPGDARYLQSIGIALHKIAAEKPSLRK